MPALKPARLIQLTRQTLGVYLFIYFLSVLRGSSIIFSDLNPTIQMSIQILLSLGLVSTVALFCNFYSRLFLFLTWVVLMVITNTKYSLFQLHQAYIGLVLVLLMLLPLQKSLTSDDESFFKRMQFLLLGLVSLNYSISGVAKIIFPGWLSGEVSVWLLNHFILRPEFKFLFKDVMQSDGRLVTFPILFLEISPIFLFLFPKTRKYAWACGVALQVFLLISCQLGQISIFMLIVHLFCYSPEWRHERKSAVLSRMSVEPS